MDCASRTKCELRDGAVAVLEVPASDVEGASHSGLLLLKSIENGHPGFFVIRVCDLLSMEWCHGWSVVRGVIGV